MGGIAVRRAGRSGAAVMLMVLLAILLTGCSRGGNADINLNGPTAVPEATTAAGGSQVEVITSTPISSPSEAPCLTTVAANGDIGYYDFRARTYPASYTVNIVAFSNCKARTINKDFRGPLHFTAVYAGAILPADYTFTAGDAGRHNFTFGQQSAPTVKDNVGNHIQTLKLTAPGGYSGTITIHFP